MKHSFICRIISVCLCLNSTVFLTSTAQSTAEKTVSYTIQPGETIYSIAHRHGTTSAHIVQLNPGMDADHVRSNSVIRVPATNKQGRLSTYQSPKSTSAPKATATRLGTQVASAVTTTAHKSTAPVPAYKNNYVRFGGKQEPQPDLPYKEYKVKRRDTAYSLAKNNGITVEELMAANPELKEKDYKLKRGMIIRIPIKSKVPAKHYTGLNPVHVAVILPLVGKGLEYDRSVEFYRGMLMGIEELKQAKTSVFVSVYNEPDVNSSIALLMNKVMAGNPDVIVGPLYPTHFNDVTSVASAQTKVAIPFSSKVPQVQYNRNVFIVNTPSAYEVALAADLFVKNFNKKTTVVFLHSLKGNKQEFSSTLQNKLLSEGYHTISLPMSSNQEQILKAMKGGKNSEYVFIPDDSSKEVLDNLLPKLTYLRVMRSDAQISLIGYDHWIELSEGSYKQQFHEANTYLLSSNYYYPYTSAAINFDNKYKQWFKTDLMKSYPRMAPLGYDFSIGFLGGLATYGRDFNTQSPKPNTVSALPKLQNEVRFEMANQSGGYVGKSMYMIHFKRDMSITKISAK